MDHRKPGALGNRGGEHALAGPAGAEDRHPLHGYGGGARLKCGALPLPLLPDRDDDDVAVVVSQHSHGCAVVTGDQLVP